MADFGFLSDTDDSAVEELISQAKELSVLEQVAAVNCSGFTDSVLPDDLETRFRRLKSLPGSRPHPVSSSKKKKKHLGYSKSASGYPKKKRGLRGGGLGSSSSSGDDEGIFSGTRGNPAEKFGAAKNSLPASASSSSSDEEPRIFSGKKRNPGVKPRLNDSSRSGHASIGSGDFSESGKMGSSSSNASREIKNFSPAKQTRKHSKEKPKIQSVSSALGLSPDSATEIASSSTDPIPKLKSKPKSKPKSPNSWLDVLSPSRAIGCIWRSPNKFSNKKTMKSSKSFSAYSNRNKDLDFDDFLSNLGTLSVEDQRKMLKKAIEEQQKMRKEATKIIKMAKQASARFGSDDQSP